MELFINGNKIDVTLEDEKTVGDVLKSFEASCIENEMETIGIELDGESVSADAFDSILDQPLKENTKIDMSVISVQEIAAAFKVAGTRLSALADKLEQISMQFQSGNGLDVQNNIRELADGIDFFCHTATLSALFPQKYGTILIGEMPLKDFFADFSPILADFRQAMESNDTVTVSDLAEYEISPRLRTLAASVEKF